MNMANAENKEAPNKSESKPRKELTDAQKRAVGKSAIKGSK